MSIFAFICPYQLLTLKKKVTFRQLFSRPGQCDPYEEDGGNIGRGANLNIKHELIDCIPVYHALYSYFDTFGLIERNSL